VGESVKRNLDNEFANLPNFQVSALSEPRDDILMWAHYANDHKGFCLEFKLDNDASFKSVYFPVHYQDEYPNLLQLSQDSHPIVRGTNTMRQLACHSRLLLAV
jgi:hypothetical protein